MNQIGEGGFSFVACLIINDFPDIVLDIEVKCNNLRRWAENSISPTNCT